MTVRRPDRLEAMLEPEKLAARSRPSWAWEASVRVTSTGVPWLDVQLGGGWRQRGDFRDRRRPIDGPDQRRSVERSRRRRPAAGWWRSWMPWIGSIRCSTAMAGVDLNRVLWMRGPAVTVEMARPALVEEVVHRAVRAFDLVIRAGGFSLVALDLSDMPSRYVRALPWATWLRLAHANEGRPTSACSSGRGRWDEAPAGCRSQSPSAVWKGASDRAGSSEDSRTVTRCFAVFLSPRADVLWPSPVRARPRVRVCTSGAVFDVWLFPHDRAARHDCERGQ